MISEVESELDIPTKTSDLTNDNGFIDNSVDNLINYTLSDETGSKIDLEINSSTYELTAKLYDKDDNLISTSTGIDLPIESMIVNVSYNDSTKKLTFTLQSGTSIEVDISDIVSGLVSDTDYASSSKAGVIKTSNSAGTTTSDGELLAQIKTYSNYTSASNNMFISKGTLENVLTEKIGDIESILEELDIGGGI